MYLGVDCDRKAQAEAARWAEQERCRQPGKAQQEHSGSICTKAATGPHPVRAEGVCRAYTHMHTHALCGDTSHLEPLAWGLDAPLRDACSGSSQDPSLAALRDRDRVCALCSCCGCLGACHGSCSPASMLKLTCLGMPGLLPATPRGLRPPRWLLPLPLLACALDTVAALWLGLSVYDASLPPPPSSLFTHTSACCAAGAAAGCRWLPPLWLLATSLTNSVRRRARCSAAAAALRRLAALLEADTCSCAHAGTPLQDRQGCTPA